MATEIHRALIVIDAQVEYLTGNLPIEFPPIKQSIRNIEMAMDAARAAGIPVVVVQQSSPPTSPVFAVGSVGWELIDEIKRRPHDHFLTKSLPSAFTGTDLETWLSSNGINTLVVAGFLTHNCDVSTIVHAVHLGVNVEFLSDASGTVSYCNRAGSASAEELHRVFSVMLQSRFAAVLTTSEWIYSIRTGVAPERDTIVGSLQQASAR